MKSPRPQLFLALSPSEVCFVRADVASQEPRDDLLDGKRSVVRSPLVIGGMGSGRHPQKPIWAHSRNLQNNHRGNFVDAGKGHEGGGYKGSTWRPTARSLRAARDASGFVQANGPSERYSGIQRQLLRMHPDRQRRRTPVGSERRT